MKRTKKLWLVFFLALLLAALAAVGMTAAAEEPLVDPDACITLPMGETVEVTTDDVLRFNTGDMSVYVITFDNEQPLTITVRYEFWSKKKKKSLHQRIC